MTIFLSYGGKYGYLEDYIELHNISDLFEELNRFGDRDSSFENSINEEFESRYGDKKSKNFLRPNIIDYT